MDKQVSFSNVQPSSNPVYVMLREITGVEGTESGVGIEWGIDWGLEEGEELPEDIEELNEAQYSAWQFIRVLFGLGDDAYLAELKRQKEDKPTGLIMPAGKKPN